MIKKDQHAFEDRQQNSVEILNQYLQVLKKKFSLMTHVMVYFSQGQNEERQEEFFDQYKHLKGEEKTILTRLRAAKDSSSFDRWTFDRFCLRIYEQFDGVTQKLKKVKLSCINWSELSAGLQCILQTSKLEEKVDLNEFLIKVISCEEAFKLQNMRKIYNQVKKSDELLAQECQSLIKLQMGLKISYDPTPDITSDQEKDYLALEKRLKDARHSVAIERALRTNTILLHRRPSNFPLAIPKKQQYRVEQVKVCHHCQALKLLNVANVGEFSHNNINRQQQKILEFLLSLNQNIGKEIEHFRKALKKIGRIKYPERIQTYYQQPSTTIDHDFVFKDPPDTTFSKSKGVSLQRAIGTRSVMMCKQSLNTTVADEKMEQNLKNMTENLKKPSLDKLYQKKQELEFLRDTSNHSPRNQRAISSVNHSSHSQMNQEYQRDDEIRTRKVVVALPRINRK